MHAGAREVSKRTVHKLRRLCDKIHGTYFAGFDCGCVQEVLVPWTIEQRIFFDAEGSGHTLSHQRA